MIEDKHSEFAKHVNELQEVLESPYSSEINKSYPRVHWAFIRTYMEGDAKDLPINPEFCEAYPADNSKSLFACSDIVFCKYGILNTQHAGASGIVMLIISSIYALGYLFQGNNYQSTKQAILHPDVKKLLT